MKNDRKSPRRLWPGGFLYAGDPVSADSLALADFVSVTAGHGCDLGCGSGILLLSLLWAHPGLVMDGVELRSGAARECRENLFQNGLALRGSVENADLRSCSLVPGVYDLVVSNPPYFPAGCGRSSPTEERRLMREESATLPELCAAAAALLRQHGRFALVHRPERQQEVFSAMEDAGIVPLRHRSFACCEGAEPSFFLCEGERGGSGALQKEAPLFQFDARGQETPEYKRITHWEA